MQKDDCDRAAGTVWLWSRIGDLRRMGESSPLAEARGLKYAKKAIQILIKQYFHT